jgi:hypothetical protein
MSTRLSATREAAAAVPADLVLDLVLDRVSLDRVSADLMPADGDSTITYVNPARQQMLSGIEAAQALRAASDGDLAVRVPRRVRRGHVRQVLRGRT